MTKTTLINKYRKVSAAHSYIIGFCYKGIVYMTRLDGNVPPRYIGYDRASKGQGMRISLYLKKCHKEELLRKNAIALCSIEDIENGDYNKGCMFEKFVTEYYGQEWTKDSIPFTVQGDINIEGVEVQIKYEGATFTNDKIITNLYKKLGA